MATAPPNSPFPKDSRRPRIFISHSSEDRELAKNVYRTVQRVGTPWMDEFDLSPGDDLEPKTLQAISAADVAIICVSRNSNSRSGFLEKETSAILREAARRSHNFILPVRFEDSPVPTVLERYLYIDVFAEGGIERLLGSLEEVREQLNNGDPDLAANASPPSTQYVQVPSIGPADSEPQADGKDRQDDSPPGAAAGVADQQFPGQLLREGSTGPSVTAVQKRLKELGFNVFADGKFGASTKAAVLEFQRKNKLRTTDGLVGPNTWAALFEQEPVELKTPAASKRKSASKKSTPRVESAVEAAAGQASATAEAQTAPTEATPKTIKEGLDEDARERKALNDKPLDDVKKDTLGFRHYVFALRDFVASQSTTTPLTISINGAWGSGKSSLMRMLQNELEPDPGPRWQRLKRTLTWLKKTPGRLRRKEVKRDPREPMWWFRVKWPAVYFYETIFLGIGRLLRKAVKRDPLEPVWWIKVKWLAGYLFGTLFWGIGWLLMSVKYSDAKYIKLAFAFAPDEDVTVENFEHLLGKYVDLSIRQDFGKQSADSDAQARIVDERKLRTNGIRFWARQAARRRKMTPPSHPTIWFNAWKFNQQEQLWAALATAVLDQLKNKYGFFARLYLLTRLTWRRTDKFRAVNHFFRKLIVPVALAGLVALYQFKGQSLLGYFPSLVDYSARLPSGTWLWLAPVLAAMWQAFKAIDNPFKIPIDELMTSPDYQGKVGFIGTFEEDFGRIVDVAIRRSIFWQPRKLIVFIDDLDRCGPTQAAGIVEAINLFLDSVGCVFVLGMDMNAVAISIEVKYQELTERMRKDAPDDVSPGVLFLDKIVQIPFNVPRPNKKFIKSLVESITEPVRRELPAIPLALEAKTSANATQVPTPAIPVGAKPIGAVVTAPPQVAEKVDRAGFAQEDVRAAIAFASGLLKENPRQVKRFINVYRLQVYIAHERKLLSDDVDRLNPRTLAVWVAWYMQWPEIVKLLSSSGQTTELRNSLAKLSAEITPEIAWPDTKSTGYFVELDDLRVREKGSASHWSHLPWQLWTKDNDFLRCLKELEAYWQRTELLESLIDMTQVTPAEPLSSATVPLPLAAEVVTPQASMPAQVH